MDSTQLFEGWLNMLRQIGTFNKQEESEDWTIYFVEGEDLKKVTVHHGWHTYRIEVFDINDEDVMTRECKWTIGEDDTIPDEFAEFMLDTFMYAQWLKEKPEIWGEAAHNIATWGGYGEKDE